MNDVTQASGGNREGRASFLVSSRFIILCMFSLNLILVYPAFFPNLSEMGMFDESYYINNGKLLAHGTLTCYAWNPLVSLLYAIIYFPIQRSPFWLIHASGIGRFVLFCLLWLSFCLIAKKMRYLVHPLIMIGCLFISPVIINLLGNPSDALFSAMSGLAFWQLLSFYQRKEVGHLWLASTFVGLAALSRNDGLVLALVLMILAGILSLSLRTRKRIPIKRYGFVIFASFMPFGAVVGSYILIYSVVTGSFGLGTAKRSYEAFEQGQGVAYRELFTTLNPYIEGQIEARKLFGAPEQNEYSVINAIRRNPSAFFRRIAQIARNIPRQIVHIYGHDLGLLFFILAAMGIVELMRKKMYLLLSIIFLWPLHLVVYFAFFFRDQYLLFSYFIVFLLASMGLNSMTSNFVRPKDHYFWLIVLGVFAMFGLTFDKAGLFATSVIIAIGFSFVWTIRAKNPNSMTIRQIGLITMFSIALILRGGYREPEFRRLGVASDERAALFMKEHLKLGSRVGAYAPGNVWVAGMNYLPMHLDLRQLNSDEAFSAWIKDQKCQAIYVDDVLKKWEPTVYDFVQSRIGRELRIAFTTEDDSVQVLLVDTAE